MLRNTSSSKSRRVTALRRIALAAVVGGLAVTHAAFADRACLEPQSVTGRTCSEATCLSLQAAVDNACKNQQLFSCNRLSTCPALQEMRRRWIDCANARDRINGTCWRGGDPGHTQASIQAWQNVSNCNVRIVRFCDDDPCPWFNGLAFQAPDAPLTKAGKRQAAEEASMDFLIPVLEKLAAEGELESFLRGEEGRGDDGAEDEGREE